MRPTQEIPSSEDQPGIPFEEMNSVIKCLICFCVVLAGVAARQTGFGHCNESTAGATPALVNVHPHSDEIPGPYNRITAEKLVRVHDAPLLERREKEDDDEVRVFRGRLTSTCISAAFLKLGSAAVLSRVFPIGSDTGPRHSLSARYLILQVFKI